MGLQMRWWVTGGAAPAARRGDIVPPAIAPAATAACAGCGFVAWIGPVYGQGYRGGSVTEQPLDFGCGVFGGEEVAGGDD